MRRQIIISASSRETRVALLEDKRLVELMLDRPDQGRLVGDVFLGRVEAVLPGIQAAFVDIGVEKAGFLHVSDVVHQDGEPSENGRDGQTTPIQKLLNKGDRVTVQVTKEPIGTKGPRLTAQVSLAGRFLVYMPFSSRVGVSRKIEDRRQRSRLRALARRVVPADSGGVIVRTVGEEATEKRFAREFETLRGSWLEIQRTAKAAAEPGVVRREARLISGVIRDLFSDKFDSLTVDSPVIFREIEGYVQGVAPDLLDRLKLYRGQEPLFDVHGIEEEIHRSFRRKVGLKSGGHLVIEPTEALVSIDVNTGRFAGRKKNDPASLILKTNLEAAREIARQLRLRDVGGIVVVDFIDMDTQKDRDKVLHELRTHLGRDRARTRAFAVSELGLIEMTRQRVRPSIFTSITDACTHCGGLGRVFAPDTVMRRVERSLKRAAAAKSERSLTVRIHPEVALHVLDSEPDFRNRVSSATGLEISLRDDPLLGEDEFRLLSGRAQVDVTGKYATV